MNQILGKDITTYIYQKVHKQYTRECFDELFDKIQTNQGNILKRTYHENEDSRTDMYHHGTYPARWWYEIERSGPTKFYRRSYPPFLQSTEVLDEETRKRYKKIAKEKKMDRQKKRTEELQRIWKQEEDARSMFL